jgi:hypothetical protein
MSVFAANIAVLISVVAFFLLTSLSSIGYESMVTVESQPSLASKFPGNRLYKRGKSPTVLFVINTHEGNYNTRVKDIRATFLKRIREKSSTELIFVTSRMPDGNPDMFPSTCPMGYWEDSCKRADLLTVASGVLSMPGMDVFDWVMFADDDSFMLPDNVQRMVMKTIEQEKNLTAVWSYYGCGTDVCRGICGGGGYLMNRETLFTIVNGGNRTEFPSVRDETNIFDKVCSRAGDLTIARAMNEIHHVAMKMYVVKGFWVMDDYPNDEDWIKTLQSEDPLPWFYHYPAKHRGFKKFQAWVDEYGSNKELED